MGHTAGASWAFNIIFIFWEKDLFSIQLYVAMGMGHEEDAGAGRPLGSDGALCPLLDVDARK